jgi:Flp pilus assembly pilin Flp
MGNKVHGFKGLRTAQSLPRTALHEKCCRDPREAISQYFWDDACISCVSPYLPRRRAEVRLEGIRVEKRIEGVDQMKIIKNFLKDESGMETLEYAVIAGLIALVAVAIYATSGTWKTTLQNRLNNAADQN